jgi:hypothetical protein
VVRGDELNDDELDHDGKFPDFGAGLSAIMTAGVL